VQAVLSQMVGFAWIYGLLVFDNSFTADNVQVERKQKQIVNCLAETGLQNDCRRTKKVSKQLSEDATL
jgi:hypothetical protein